MIILGIVLIVLGLIFGIGLLFWAGLIIGIIGLVLLFVGASHPVGGRRYWY